MIISLKGNRAIWTKRNRSDFGSFIKADTTALSFNEIMVIKVDDGVLLLSKANLGGSFPVIMKPNLGKIEMQMVVLCPGFVYERFEGSNKFTTLKKRLLKSGVKTISELMLYLDKHCRFVSVPRGPVRATCH